MLAVKVVVLLQQSKPKLKMGVVVLTSERERNGYTFS